MENNGKSEEIVRLQERYAALKEDLQEYKESEKEIGKKISDHINELYKKSSYNLNAINEVNAKVIKITAAGGAAVTILTLILKFLV